MWKWTTLFVGVGVERLRVSDDGFGLRVAMDRWMGGWTDQSIDENLGEEEEGEATYTATAKSTTLA